MHIHPGNMNMNIPLRGADTELAARRAETARKKLLAAAAELDSASSSETAWIVGAWAGQSGQSDHSEHADQFEQTEHIEQTEQAAKAGQVEQTAAGESSRQAGQSVLSARPGDMPVSEDGGGYSFSRPLSLEPIDRALPPSFESRAPVDSSRKVPVPPVSYWA